MMVIYLWCYVANLLKVPYSLLLLKLFLFPFVLRDRTCALALGCKAQLCNRQANRTITTFVFTAYNFSLSFVNVKESIHFNRKKRYVCMPIRYFVSVAVNN